MLFISSQQSPRPWQAASQKQKKTIWKQLAIVPVQQLPPGGTNAKHGCGGCVNGNVGGAVF